ncbi:MAG: MerR family DNA-binding protein [Gammaproteobacteria bacterium]|nr:MerR family DNA-binding protein [Gammaproteobacteria bacterium]
MRASLTIGALAGAADVGVETVRYYQRRRLLPEPPRPLGGIRRYGEAEVARLRFIRHAQELGFTLDEVAELLALDEGRECDEAKRLAGAKLAVVRQRLTRLRRIERALAEQVRACERSGGRQRCPLIEVLAQPMPPLRSPRSRPRRPGKST